MNAERVAECRSLLERARCGQATADELEALGGMVEEVLDELLAVGAGHLRDREQPRGDARLRRAVPVELSWAGATQRGVTLDLSAGGFCALLPAAPGRDVIAVARLRLGSEEGLTCSARVVDVRERRGAARVSVAFAGLRDEERARLQRFLVEDALTQLGLRKGVVACPPSSELRPKLAVAR